MALDFVKRLVMIIMISLLCKVVLPVPQNAFYRPGIRSRNDNNNNNSERNSAYSSTVSKSFGLRGKLSYSMGERIVGDRMLTQIDGGDNYPAARDVDVTLRYPRVGTDATITHVNILVDQSSELGNAVITSGGIRDKHIEILLWANTTSRFFYSGVFYGY